MCQAATFRVYILDVPTSNLSWNTGYSLFFPVLHSKPGKKVNVLPITGHCEPEGEWRYSPTLSWPRHLDGGRWLAPRPGRFTPRKDTVPIVTEAG